MNKLQFFLLGFCAFSLLIHTTCADEDKQDGDADPQKVDGDVDDEMKKLRESLNGAKPIWLRDNMKEVTDEEYDEFYKAIANDSDNPLATTHFVARREVFFHSILFIPLTSPSDIFSDDDGKPKRREQIKLFDRHTLINDTLIPDVMVLPKYFSFVRGIVDSYDLQHTLQQHKLLKHIQKKMFRETVDMIKKIDDSDYMDKFWKEYSINIKLGVMEHDSNQARLAKLLLFPSSNDPEKMTSLDGYLSRMKEEHNIFFMAGESLDEVKSSPYVERVLKKGYEVLYLIESLDEHCVQSLPHYDGQQFQNVLKIDEKDKIVESKEEL